MPKLPWLTPSVQHKVHTDVFQGYNHKLRISTNQWYDTTNLTTDQFPLMATRPARGEVTQLSKPAGLAAKDSLLVIDGSNVIFNGKPIDLRLNNAAPKQLVSMGAYLVIFPDKKYFNTADTEDFGDLEALYTSTSSITYELCDNRGNLYEGVMTQPTEPENPANGTLWLDDSNEDHVLLQYSESSATWVQIPTVYVRIESANIGKAFEQYDGVTISGAAGNQQIEALNSSHVIWEKDDNWIVVVGLIDNSYTQASGKITVSRSVPDMDYVCEAGNRLWGCKYGLVNGKTLNEIYGCKLGDFKNWNCFMGISTDSWAASVGSDGQFTAAVNYLGMPTFFKEEVIHRVSISSSGAHAMQDTICSGVQKGSWRSPAVAGEILYYKGRSGIYAYDGSQPVSVSEAFGDVRYRNAVGGSVGNKYYVSMEDMAGMHHLFSYDTEKRLWMREDNTEAMMFASADGDLFYIDAQSKKLMSVMGTQGTKENSFRWEAVSGIQHYEDPEKKYLGRYNFRAKLYPGSSFKLEMQYDSDGVWHDKGTVNGDRLYTFTLPVIPRRCDHLQFRITGHGEMQLFSITRVYEQGSDM
jgi:hypothetical protein